MRKLATIAALGLVTLAGTAMARVAPTADETSNGGTGSGGGVVRSNDCPGAVVFDSGMTDSFTPPAGCSSAGGVNCWVNAPGSDLRPVKFEVADEFSTNGEQLTHIKFWERYSCEAYNAGVRTLGYCIAIYETTQDQLFCPDGVNTSELGTLIYDGYAGAGEFTEQEITGFLLRNFNVCVTLDNPVPTTAGKVYWVAISGDMPYSDLGDACDPNGQNTLVFIRFTNQGSGFTACEAAIRGCEPDGTLCDPWDAISSAFGLPCWAGWDLGLTVYGIPAATGACCAASGECSITTAGECFGQYYGDNTTCDPNPCPQPAHGACCLGIDCLDATPADCQSYGGEYKGDGTVCDPNPCLVIPTEKMTFGGVKAKYSK